METEVPTVYGASKHEQKVTEAPSAVTLVTAEEIKQQGHRTLADVLNGVPGFYVTGDRGFNYVGVRGFNRPGDYGGRILLTVDGQRVNDPIFDASPSGLDFPLDVDLIERVEVIRGPGSSLYGNNALFGVINVITRRGRDFKGVEGSFSAGGFATYAGRLSYGNQFSNGVELAVSGSYFDSGGEANLFYPEYSSVRQGVATHRDGSHGGSLFSSLSYRDFSLQSGLGYREKDLPTGAYDAVFNDPRNRVMEERAFAQLQYQARFGVKGSVNGIALFPVLVAFACRGHHLRRTARMTLGMRQSLVRAGGTGPALGGRAAGPPYSDYFRNRLWSSVVWPPRNATSLSGSAVNQAKVPQAISATSFRKAGAARSKNAERK